MSQADARRLAAAAAHWLSSLPDGVGSSAERRAYAELRDRLTAAAGAPSGTDSGDSAMDAGIMGDVISVADFAALRGCRPEYVRRLCRQGRLPAVRAGRDWWIDREAAS